MGWTKEQEQAIYKKGANILVSAAAGSGKTSVLVERIINKIINDGVDVDKILVVTFTSAAASEMKERLLKALYKKIDENPENLNLQRQISLLNRADISTIHSFCLKLIKNNFYVLDMPANFRIGNEIEVEIIREEVIEEIFEKKYEKSDEEFEKLLNLYTNYTDDTPLKELIFNIYDFSRCSVNPKKWLEAATEEYNLKNANIKDFSETKWGNIILEYVEDIIYSELKLLKNARVELENEEELLPFYEIISNDINIIEKLDLKNWDNLYNSLNMLNFEQWSRKAVKSESNKELKENAKKVRDLVKKEIDEKIKKVICFLTKDIIDDMSEMYQILSAIKKLVEEFDSELSKRKKEKNIIDFSDFEHLSLKLLIDENGEPSEIAKKHEYQEILIDEYQDINEIQEKILTSVSNNNNIFMVGDVKQSIYRFRQSRPDIFIGKYENYEQNEINFETLKNSTKIQLYKNFRSRKNVLDITNQIFKNIMTKNLGEIEYTEDEYLNLGVDFEEKDIDFETEMYLIEMNKEEQDSEENVSEEEIVDKALMEARLISKKIKEMIEKGYKYSDIAILLKSTKNQVETYEKELLNNGIPVYSDAGSEYLDSIEIDTILSFLKIIDNPLQDIPLVTVLRSPIIGLTDNELLELRLIDKNLYFYELLEISENEKVKRFLELLKELKEFSKENTIDMLIWRIYTLTGYLEYVKLMPNGNLRQANLKKLFETARDYESFSYKGLFNFIIFMEKVSKMDTKIPPAKIIGEKDDVVKIMTIHKSKGLEFPVVFVSGITRNTNLQDIKKSIIYDQNLGFGVDFINEISRYSLPTKEAMKLKINKETLSEAMRVLYVALTRAKDKLFLVGADKNILKSIEDKKKMLEIYYSKDSIDYRLVGKYIKMSDWIMLAVLKEKNSRIKQFIVNSSDLTQQEDNNEEQNINLLTILENSNKINQEKYKKIENMILWKYKYQNSINEITKTSVTKLKQGEEEISIKELKDFESKNEKITKAKLGTLIHLALQKLEDTNIEKLIESLKISNNEKKELLRHKKIFENYINSDLYKMIKEAKNVKKELYFYMNIKSENSDDKILIQGIIDLYFETSDGKIVLVDYKTDNVNIINELEERYYSQLILYKNAIENLNNKKVDKMYIYSTKFDKLLEIEE